METVNCYNKGCGQKFNPSDNSEVSCTFHPGVPVFHDALKGWSCCKKRSTDFTEFLNIPGCTKGCHSNEKPESQPPQVESSKEKLPTMEEIKPPEPREPLEKQKPMERPSLDEEKIELKKNVGQTLLQALEKQMKEAKISTETKETDESVVQVGTSCKNNGCKYSYENENCNSKVCEYHPGVPIFHEGLKYWTCCKRKTTDFDNFLNQEGCSSGKHLWIKKEDPTKKKVVCRQDWHQTPTFVTISVFAKVAIPDKSTFKVNKVSLSINIAFGEEGSIFQEDIILHGIIDPERSNVKMLGSKVEINLRKAEAGSWPSLHLKEVEKEDKVAANN